MSKIKDIPKNWEIMQLKEACEVVTGTTPPKADKSNYGSSIPFFKPPHLWDSIISETDEMLSNTGASKARIVPPNTVLVTCIGNLGRTGLVNKKAAFNQQINAILENDILTGKFIFYQAQSPNFKNQLEKLATGTTVSIVNKGNFETINICIPPLPEQQAIVSKIEELLSKLENGKQQLLTAQQQLKVYRQSLLKWAFEGKITNKNVKEGELPKGWKFEELKNLCVIKRGKSKHRPRNEPALYGGKYPFIQTGDIREVKGGYIKKYSQTYSELGFQQSKLWPKGTLCITIAANIGETAILDFDACFPDSVVGLLSDEKLLLNNYTNYFFISHKSKLEKLAPATAQKNINVDILEKVRIPLPSIEEQQHIVSELESKLTVCDKIEETICQSLLQAETLRQSILKKAFEGNLP
jgi:type I restriction enzyme S subunit